METMDGGSFTFWASSLPSCCKPVLLIKWDILKHHCKHLKNLPPLESRGRIDLMIGLDLTHLLCTSDSREGEVD